MKEFIFLFYMYCVIRGNSNKKGVYASICDTHHTLYTCMCSLDETPLYNERVLNGPLGVDIREVLLQFDNEFFQEKMNHYYLMLKEMMRKYKYHQLTLSNLSYCLYRKSETKNKESFNKEVFLFFTFVERYRSWLLLIIQFPFPWFIVTDYRLNELVTKSLSYGVILCFKLLPRNKYCIKTQACNFGLAQSYIF